MKITQRKLVEGTFKMSFQEEQAPLPKRTKVCGHCDRALSSVAYRTHLQRFYDYATNTWRKDNPVPLQTVKPFMPTLLREKAFKEASIAIPQSEDLQTTDELSEVQFQTCDSDAGMEDASPTIQDYTPDVHTDSDDEHNSSGNESPPCNAAEGNSLPYDLERVMRAYTLLILFLQFQHSLSNSCIRSLLQATHTFLGQIANVVKDERLTTLAATFPSTLYRLKSWLHIPEATFQEYVVCPTCGWTYKGETCKRSRDTPFLCTNTVFPNHPQQSRIQQCQTPLTKVERTSDGVRVNLLNRLCYNPIAAQLAHILHRFETEITQTSVEVHNDTLLFDIEDGPTHRSRLALLSTNDDSHEKRLVINVNVDWFQPFKHLTHSVGAIYASINNLPRQFRYQMENVLLVAVIPGPKEPVQMNSIMSILVDEMKDLQLGVSIGGTPVKVALECMACDIPAARKTGGFASHSSTHGCTCCLKAFPFSKDMNKVDSSGYAIDTWEPRNDQDVISTGTQYQMARSRAEQEDIVKRTGVKYSPLQTLEYFSPVKDIIIDPMHNLFLGIAKTTLRTWKDKRLLSDDTCKSIQSKVNSVIVPRDVGRIPSKLASGFSSMTADEWRLWTILYSAITLKDALPQEHRLCWDLFVHACTVFCSKAITQQLCDYGQECMVSFCVRFQELYGNAACVPNMHFACHLGQYLQDHGPAYGFWLFPFERMNGLLGDTFTNNQDITKQFMCHFINKCRTLDLVCDLPADLQTAFFPDGLTNSTKKTSGGVRHSCDIVDVTRARLPLQLGTACGNIINQLTGNRIPQTIIRPEPEYLTSSEISSIHKLLCMISGKEPESIHIERGANVGTKCLCGGTEYTADASEKGDIVYGRGWDDNRRHQQILAGKVKKFIDITFSIEGKQLSLVLSAVAWYAFTGNTTIPFPWQEVTSTTVETVLPFIPIACVLSRAAKCIQLSQHVLAPVDFPVHDTILRHLM